MSNRGGTQEIQNANALEGTLAYLSPEQTGRMNRGIDYRSDFYGLGVTFYELLTVDEIVKTGAVVNTITLQPLSLVDMNQLVADTLNCDLPLAQPLTELVYQKTKGNPFFATQFLKALHDDRLITFDGNIRYWQCDIAQVKALAITDDVVEFMALQLQKLPIATQAVSKSVGKFIAM